MNFSSFARHQLSLYRQAVTTLVEQIQLITEHPNTRHERPRYSTGPKMWMDDATGARNRWLSGETDRIVRS
jgi:hypothetical protein